MSRAKDLLLDATERLVAEDGARVSLRDIATAAGQRNNSAVQYHFGSREALFEAVVRRRQVCLEERRFELLTALRESDGLDDPGALIRALVGVLVQPMAELLEREQTYYARFLQQVRNHAVLTTGVALADSWPASQEVMTRLAGATPVGSRRLAGRRRRALATTMFALLADAERAGAPPDVDDLVAMLVGLLTAPVVWRDQDPKPGKRAK